MHSLENWAILELYCGESGKLGYYNSQELGLARALRRREIYPTIVYPVKGLRIIKEQKTAEGIVILHVPCKTVGVHAIYNLEFLLERKINVVHLDSDNQMFAPGVMNFCRRHHIFFYNYVGTIYSNTENLVKKCLMKYISDRNIRCFQKSPVLVKTEAVKRCLEKQDVKRIEVIPVGLDTTHIEKDSRDKKNICKELGFPENKLILLFVGRLEEYKRPFAAIELLKNLGEAYYLVMIGNGSLKEELKNKILREKLENQVACFEKIPNTSMYQYYKACDYYINFNVHEIFGMSILEAMYQRCVVVARRAPGPEEIIEDGISGYLCSTDEKMREAILTDRDADMGEQAEKRILSSFTWEQSAEKILQFVNSRRGKNRPYKRKVDKLEIPVCNILGVNIAAVNMKWLVNYLVQNVKVLSGDYITVANVHTTVMAYENPVYCQIQNGGIMAIPDGGPLSSIGRKRGFENMCRSTGPDLMGEIFQISSKTGYLHYFYGATEETLEILRMKLEKTYPELKIAGMYAPPFRPMTKEEDNKIIEVINEAAPDFVWIGLGAPKQEMWMGEHQGKVSGLMIGVGAGFDYFAGNIKRAPSWMQKHNLEWLYRLCQEPRRLFKRYLITNTKFLWLTARGK